MRTLCLKDFIYLVPLLIFSKKYSFEVPLRTTELREEFRATETNSAGSSEPVSSSSTSGLTEAEFEEDTFLEESIISLIISFSPKCSIIEDLRIPILTLLEGSERIFLKTSIISCGEATSKKLCTSIKDWFIFLLAAFFNTPIISASASCSVYSFFILSNSIELLSTSSSEIPSFKARPFTAVSFLFSSLSASFLLSSSS